MTPIGAERADIDTDFSAISRKRGRGERQKTPRAKPWPVLGQTAARRMGTPPVKAFPKNAINARITCPAAWYPCARAAQGVVAKA
jgi:hypothetical protein